MSSGLFQGSVIAKLLAIFSDISPILESYFDLVKASGILCNYVSTYISTSYYNLKDTALLDRVTAKSCEFDRDDLLRYPKP